MDRRKFLGSLVGGLALGTARQWPFRVFSFPSEIKIARPTFTTTWGVVSEIHEDGRFSLRWLGKWDDEKLNHEPFALPQLSEAQMKTMLELAKKNGAVGREDWRLICP